VTVTTPASTTPQSAPSIHANAGNGLTFFTGCDDVRIAIAELESRHPRPAFVTKTLNQSAEGFRQTAIPGLVPYAAALKASVGQLPQNQLTTLHQTLAMCRASHQ
jgi:hypothetical protein